jgi:hypothetical protein
VAVDRVGWKYRVVVATGNDVAYTNAQIWRRRWGNQQEIDTDGRARPPRRFVLARVGVAPACLLRSRPGWGGGVALLHPICLQLHGRIGARASPVAVSQRQRQR